jgi:hypothetical protein
MYESGRCMQLGCNITLPSFVRELGYMPFLVFDNTVQQQQWQQEHTRISICLLALATLKNHVPHYLP